MPKAVKEPSGVPARIEALVRPAVEGLGLRLWDVRLKKEGGQWALWVVIDRDTPLDTDTCEAASRAVDPLLDALDPIEQSYCLVVSSPGLGRHLCRRHHFSQMAGRTVEAKLYAPDEKGQKTLRGLLVGMEEDVVTLRTQEGPVRVETAAAAHFKLCDDENLL